MTKNYPQLKRLYLNIEKMATDVKILENKYFQKEYLCYSLSTLETGNLNTKKLEFSDKIVLPCSALDILSRFQSFDSSPMTFRLNKSGSLNCIYAGVIDFSADDRKMYVPRWMMEVMFIQEGQRVSITSVTIPKAEYIKLKPRDERFLKLQNPKNVLENHLKDFTTLYKGQTIRINYLNREWEIDVLETMPTDAVCINNANVILDLVSEEILKRQEQQQKELKKLNEMNEKKDESSTPKQVVSKPIPINRKQADPNLDHPKSAGYFDKDSYWNRFGGGGNSLK